MSFLLLLVLFFILLLLSYVVFIYNSLVRLKNNITKAWSNIDVLLKQRFDELPNLVEVVKNYGVYEKNLLTDIIRIRSDYRSIKSIKDAAEINQKTNNLVNSFFLTLEKYPDLKANKHFLELQKRITTLENMIADRREYFNDYVTLYNTRIEQIPYNLFAKILKYYKKDLFVTDEKETPKIKI